MALVTLDCLTSTPRWPRGALTGLAAAVKLTPAAFVLFFLLRKDWKAAGMALASFGACAAAGFFLDPADSARYWTSAIFQVGRPTFAAYTSNQSILGTLVRAGLEPQAPTTTAVWLILSALVVLLAVRGMRRALARSQDTWALSLNAFAILLASPISWSHHWVWAGPGLMILAFLSWRYRNLLWCVTAAIGFILLAVAPHWYFPPGGYGWAAWQQVIGSSYVILALAILVIAQLQPDKHELATDPMTT
jgi:alpha-1,2-mannosyltransferase